MSRNDRKSGWRDALEYAAYRIGWELLGRLPEGISHTAASGLARLAFTLDDRRADVSLVNLRIAFPGLPDSEYHRIAQESYQHIAWNAIDLASASRREASQLLERFELIGWENYERAMAAGRGAVVVTAHLGSFECALQALSTRARGLTVAARPLSNRRVSHHLFEQRARTGARIVPHRGSLRDLLKTIRRGQAVVFANDQYARRTRGIPIPFFGVRALTSPGPALLALRCGAPLLPFYTFRMTHHRHRAVVMPAIISDSTGDRKADLARLTAELNTALEGAIRDHPEQWIWGHRRFRNSPDLPDDPYATRTDPLPDPDILQVR
ncbi:lysophospholipid acyltransferase family protein [Myxococcota bacterium]|nr:lysophospholipid acyltransferase family protein [Myxococcota bacterium]